jgi:hypothetical protein
MGLSQSNSTCQESRNQIRTFPHSDIPGPAGTKAYRHIPAPHTICMLCHCGPTDTAPDPTWERKHIMMRVSRPSPLVQVPPYVVPNEVLDPWLEFATLNWLRNICASSLLKSLPQHQSSLSQLALERAMHIPTAWDTMLASQTCLAIKAKNDATKTWAACHVDLFEGLANGTPLTH